MNSFSIFICTFCATSVIIGLLYMLVPESFASSLKFCFGIIFILSIVSCFISVKTVSLPDLNVISSVDYNEETLTKTACLTYETALRNAHINFNKIKVCTNKLEDNSIVITKVIIYSGEEKGKILNVLKEITKVYEVEIINE